MQSSSSLTKNTLADAPKPISSPKEIDGNEAWYRARADGTDCETARDAIFKERLADGTAEPSLVTSFFRKVLSLESSADKVLESARNERARVTAIQHDWERQVETIDAMKKDRLDLAAQEVSAARQSEEHCRDLVFQKIGKFDHPVSAYTAAANAVEAGAALPLLEAAEKALIEAYWTKVQTAREFGVENGIPNAALASLPSRE
jgi:hypothetical protein